MSHQVLITGAAGFIGSHLCDRLLLQGNTVLGVDDFSLGTRSNLQEALQHPAFKLLEGDVSDAAWLTQTVQSALNGGTIDQVWHRAANSDISAGVTNPQIDLQRTFLTTHGVLAMMRQLGIGRLAFASTSAIYGLQTSPIREEAGPLFPVSNYGAMKLASEAAISAALESFLERVCIFRFPNVVGPRSTHGAIHDFVAKLRKNPAELEVLGDGNQQKPYLHVQELVEAMLFITQHSSERLNYFNIGPADDGATVRFMAETVVQKSGSGARILYTGGDRGWVGDVPKFYYSVAKLNNLGWRAQMSSSQAIERAVEELLVVNGSR